MTTKQWQKIKSSIIDTNNYLNRIFLPFDSLNHEFSPEFILIDIFSSYFSFHQANYKDKESKEAYLCNFDEIFKNVIIDLYSVVIISDASIKNNIVASHIHSNSNGIKKTIYQAVNIILTKAELFAI